MALALAIAGGCASEGHGATNDRGDDAGASSGQSTSSSTGTDARVDQSSADGAVRGDAATDVAQVQDAGGDAARPSSEDASGQGGAERDAAADAGTSDAAASGSCPSSALFCETFEAAEPGQLKPTSRYDINQNNGTLSVDEARARGRRSLHVHTQLNGFAQLRVLDFAPPNNSFYGRMHLYAEALPTAPNHAHYTLVEAAGMQPGLIRAVGGQYIGEQRKNLLGPGTDQGPTGDWTNWKPSAELVSGKWVCLEFQVDAADNTMRIWMDGVAKPDLTVSTKMHPGGEGDLVFPTFDRIWFGWWLYQGGSTPDHFDLWLDDIALASTRLGC